METVANGCEKAMRLGVGEGSAGIECEWEFRYFKTRKLESNMNYEYFLKNIQVLFLLQD